MEKPFKIFISYAAIDRPMLEMLEKHLKPVQLAYKNRLIVWSDRSIQPGQFWDEEIRSNLATADICLMLTSPNSLSSDYVAGIEIPVSIERSLKGETLVVPVILRPCAWQFSGLAQFQVLPKSGQPISAFPNPDLAFVEIVDEVAKLVESKIGKPAPRGLMMPKPLSFEKTSIEQKIAVGDFAGAIDEFMSRAKKEGNDKQYRAGLMLLLRWKQLENDRLEGIMSWAESSRYSNQLVHRLLELNRTSEEFAAV